MIDGFDQLFRNILVQKHLGSETSWFRNILLAIVAVDRDDIADNH